MNWLPLAAVQAVVIVRFCPQLFCLRKTDPNSDEQASKGAAAVFQLPYRMVFAIATLDSVIIYDTQVLSQSQHVFHCKLSRVYAFQLELSFRLSHSFCWHCQCRDQ